MEELYLDSVLVGLSLLLLVGYHVFLRQSFLNKPFHTTIEIHSHARRAWIKSVTQSGDSRKSMQVIQTLRNSMAIIILRASISIVVCSAAAALTNNAYKGSAHLFKNGVVGSKSNRVFALKYEAVFLMFVMSFVCSSVGVGFLADASVGVGIPGEGLRGGNVERLVERGFLMAFVGERLMWISLAALLWTLGPLAVLVGSLALVWVFFVIDFPGKSGTCNDNMDLYN